MLELEITALKDMKALALEFLTRKFLKEMPLTLQASRFTNDTSQNARNYIRAEAEPGHHITNGKTQHVRERLP